MLVVCFILVLAFEATNGFHDTANAVATVIYTHALRPVPAVIWSGLLNFVGVIVGGITVAYALVDILPPDVLTRTVRMRCRCWWLSSRQHCFGTC